MSYVILNFKNVTIQDLDLPSKLGIFTTKDISFRKAGI